MLALLTLTLVVASAPPDDPTPMVKRGDRMVPEYLAYPYGYPATPAKPHLVFMQIPLVIDVPEWEKYSKRLHLSGAQSKALAGAYDQYRRDEWAFRIKHTHSLTEQSMPLAAKGVNDYTLEDAQLLTQINKDAQRLAPEFRQMEGQLFTHVQEVLSEKQLPLLEIVRSQRERKVLQQIATPFPACWYDLDNALYELDQRGVDVTPHDQQIFDVLLQTWRAEVNAAWRLHAEQFGRLTQRSTLLTFYSLEAGRAKDFERVNTLRDEEEQLRKPGTKTARHVLDLDTQAVRAVAEQLSEPARTELWENFEKAAYKPLLPDPGRLGKVFDVAQDLKLTSDQQSALTQLREGWQVESDLGWTRILEEYLSWREHVWTRGYGGDDYTEYTKHMSDSMNARINKGETTVSAILAILTEKQGKKLAGEIKKWRDVVASFRGEQQSAIDRYEHWPPPTE